MKNRIFPLLLALLVLLGCMGFSALAHEVPDVSRTGTIALTLETISGDAVEGEVTAYRVGDIIEADGNYGFALTDAFTLSGVTLNDVQSPEIAAALAEYAADCSAEGITEQIDETGHVTFAVKSGLYLLVQTKTVQESETFNPFLISIPNTENGAYVYDVTANPKVSPIPDATEPPAGTVPPETEPVPPDEEKLPQTGQLNWPVPILAVAGMTLFAAGWALRFRGRKEDYEA